MPVFIPKRALAVTPHADDVTLFAGGTLALWAEAGCKILVIRVTQDEKDSFAHSIDETIAINRREFQRAMNVLGVQQTCDLDYRDCELMDVSHSELREKLIRNIREFKPEIILSFDPASIDDENPDHTVVARATADASWASGYPNFHPEHKDDGLLPHTALGQYYFTRHFIQGDTVVDISTTIERKLHAVISHANMMCTVMEDQRRRLEQAGFNLAFIKNRAASNYAEYWKTLVVAAAQMAAGQTAHEYVERFRSTLISDEDPLLQLLSSLE